MLQKLTPREKKLLFVLSITVIIVFFIKLFIQIQLPQYQAAKANLVQKQQEKNTALNLVQSIKLLESQKEELLTKRQELFTQFQIYLEAGSPLIHLSQDNTNLQLVSIKPYPVNKTEHYSNLQLDMKISGSYISVLKYLEKIETLPTVAEIVQPNITQIGQDTVSCDFILYLYSAGNNVGRGEILSQITGKYDVFTPLVQVLTPPSSEANSNDAVSNTELLVQNEMPAFSEQNKVEEPKQEKNEIYYHFPVK